MKYKLIRMTNKENGNIERAVIIYKTGEIVTEVGQPDRYRELRKRSILNKGRREFNLFLKDITGTSARAARMDIGL